MLNNQNTQNNNTNNTKELLNMFWAAHHIQEEMMYIKPTQDLPYGKYQKEYRVVLIELKQLHEDISETLEGKVFEILEPWANDLYGILDQIIKEEYGELTEENREKYFNENVKKYVDEYIEKFPIMIKAS